MFTEYAHTVNGSRVMDAELELEPCSVDSTLQSGPQKSFDHIVPKRTYIDCIHPR